MSKQVVAGIIVTALFLSLTLLLGCTLDSTLVPPFSFCQLVAKTYEIDGITKASCASMMAGDYNGWVLGVGGVDGNSPQWYDSNSFGGGSGSSSWLDLTDFPVGCDENQAVQIIGTTLTCIDLPLDSNCSVYGSCPTVQYAQDLNADINALINPRNYLTDATSDGNTYGRKDGAWEKIVSSEGNQDLNNVMSRGNSTDYNMLISIKTTAKRDTNFLVLRNDTNAVDMNQTKSSIVWQNDTNAGVIVETAKIQNRLDNNFNSVLTTQDGSLVVFTILDGVLTPKWEITSNGKLNEIVTAVNNSAREGEINSGVNGVYSYASATRYIRFNTSGSANDFQSAGAPVIFNFSSGIRAKFGNVFSNDGSLVGVAGTMSIGGTDTTSGTFTSLTAPANGMIVRGSVGFGTPSPTGNFQVFQPIGATYGTASIVNGQAWVTGTNGTMFRNTFKIGDSITINAQTRVIDQVNSDTNMHVTSNWTSTNNNLAYLLTSRTVLTACGNGKVSVDRNGVSACTSMAIFDVNGTTKLNSDVNFGETNNFWWNNALSQLKVIGSAWLQDNNILYFGTAKDVTVKADANSFSVMNTVGTKQFTTNMDINTSNNLYVDGNSIIGKDLNVGRDLRVDGNVFFNVPYGTFVSEKTQTVGSTTVAYPVDFNVTEDVFMINKYGDTNFGVGIKGDYEIILSIIAIGENNKHIDVWLEKNGVNVVNSNTKLEFGVTGAETIIAVSWIIDLNTSDRIRVMYHSDDTGTTLPYTPPSVSPNIPATPSSIMTIKKIGEDMS